jgi:hypothetical protein
MQLGDLSGLIPFLGGIYCYLLAIGVLPRHAKEKERWAEWRVRFGPMIKILAPLLVLFGALELIADIF